MERFGPFFAKKGDYLAEGKVQFTVDGSDVVAEPGTTVFLPRKTPHSFKIIGDKLMRRFS